MKQHKVDNHMTRNPTIVSPKLPLKNALDHMQTCNIRHLPVIEDEHPVGMLSESDLKQALAHPQSASLLVEDVMTRDVYTVSRQTQLADVVEVMAGKKYGSAIVIDENNKPIGIFTTVDGMRLLAELLQEHEGWSKRFESIERFMFPYPQLWM